MSKESITVEQMTVSKDTQVYIDCLIKLNEVFNLYGDITNKMYGEQYDEIIDCFAEPYHKLREVILKSTIENIDNTLLNLVKGTEI